MSIATELTEQIDEFTRVRGERPGVIILTKEDYAELHNQFYLSRDNAGMLLFNNIPLKKCDYSPESWMLSVNDYDHLKKEITKITALIDATLKGLSPKVGFQVLSELTT